jgi:hypothetical protein
VVDTGLSSRFLLPNELPVIDGEFAMAVSSVASQAIGKSNSGRRSSVKIQSRPKAGRPAPSF